MSYTCFTCNREFEPKYKPSNSNKPFCSRSCAAKHNNTLRGKPKSVCQACSQELKTGTKYCSNKCQALERTGSLLIHWLETGQLAGQNAQTNGLVPRYVKEYLLKKQNYLCAICNIPNKWTAKDLIFIADHIDGIITNNHITNLRMVCPNCDSQLPTYKSKNKGKGRTYRRSKSN